MSNAFTFWLGLLLSIPIAIVVNLISPRVDKYFKQRSSKSRARAASRRNRDMDFARWLARHPDAHANLTDEMRHQMMRFRLAISTIIIIMTLLAILRSTNLPKSEFISDTLEDVMNSPIVNNTLEIALALMIIPLVSMAVLYIKYEARLDFFSSAVREIRGWPASMMYVPDNFNTDSDDSAHTRCPQDSCEISASRDRSATTSEAPPIQ